MLIKLKRNKMIKTQIIGNIGKDAEERILQDGKKVINFNVAVQDGWGDKKTTIWFSCSAFGTRFENTSKYLTKGTKVYVEGQETPKLFEGQNGFVINRNMLVNDLRLLGGGEKTEQTQNATPTQQFEQKTGIPATNVNTAIDNNVDDGDLPF